MKLTQHNSLICQLLAVYLSKNFKMSVALQLMKVLSQKSRVHKQFDNPRHGKTTDTLVFEYSSEVHSKF